jgi:hypothetical protein
MYVECRVSGIYAIEHTKKVGMAYVLKCNMQCGAAVNHHVEIAQKLVHVCNLKENSETYLNGSWYLYVDQ